MAPGDIVAVAEFLEDCFGDEQSNSSRIEKVLLSKRKDSKLIEEKAKALAKQIPKEQAASKSVIQDLESLLEGREELQPLILETLENTSWQKDFISCMHSHQHLTAITDYLSKVQEVQNLSSQIHDELLGNSIYSALEVSIDLARVVEGLSSSSCKNLVDYCTNVLDHWHSVLARRVSRQMQNVLTSLHWPLITSGGSLPNSEAAVIAQEVDGQLKNIRLLYQLESFGCYSAPQQFSFFTENLVLPFKNRFLFHFYGEKATNKLDKPEWFLTQVLNWLRDHVPLLSNLLKSFFRGSNSEQVDANKIHDDFIGSLVGLCAAKLQSVLPIIVDDEDGLFGHWIDEVLSFEQELDSLFSCHSAKNQCLSLLTKQRYLQRWLQIEQACFLQDIDSFLNADGAWELKIKDPSLDCGFKVPQCVDNFITDLHLMSDRYQQLADSKAQVQFSDLQALLLDQFVTRVCELLPQSDKNIDRDAVIPAVNGMQYISNVLEDWKETSLFLLIGAAREQQHDAGTDDDQHEDVTQDDPWTILGEKLSNAISKTIECLASSVEHDIYPLIKSYKTGRWHALELPKQFVIPVLSTNACHLVVAIKHKLNDLQGTLAAELFDALLPDVMQRIDQNMFQEVVMDTQFNKGGAAQFQFDMCKNLFVLFSQWNANPGNHLKRTHDSCKLLNLLPGSGALLKDMVTTCSKSDHRESNCCQRTRTFLEDNDVTSLDLNQVKRVLETRIDWPQL